MISHKGAAGQVAAILDKDAAAAPHIGFDHRMSAALYEESEAVVDGGAAEIAGRGEVREGGGDVKFGQRIGDGAQALRLGGDGIRQPREDRRLDGESGVMRLGDAALEFGQFRGGKAHGIGQRLAVNEAFAMRGLEQLRAMARGHLDEIAEHAIVPDLQRANVGVLDQSRLQRCHDGARLRREGPFAVEGRVVAAADETAIAGQQRRLIIDGIRQFGGERRRGIAEAGDDARHLVRNVGHGRKPIGQRNGAGNRAAHGVEIARPRHDRVPGG